MKLTVNDQELTISAEDLEKNLLTFLREDLDLTGAKNGCNIGVCGACTVLLDNKAIRACKKKVADVLNGKVLTIEGLEQNGVLAPLQQAFIDHGAVQCGFCTPGMILTAHALLLQNATPTRAQIRSALQRNLCRCTGYQQIVDAVAAASKFYQ